MFFGPLKHYYIKGKSVFFEFEQNIGKIEVVSDSIIRVFSGDEQIKSHAVNKSCSKNLSEFTVKKQGEKIIISTSKVTVTVENNFYVDFYKPDGTLVCKDYRGQRRLRSAVSEEERKLLEQEGHKASEISCMHSIQVVKEQSGDECYYGLGDKTGFLNKRFYDYEMWNTDNPNPQVDSFKAMYKSIPFFITLKSNCVYGIFFDNHCRSFFDMGKESNQYYYFGAEDGNLDYYYFAGESIPEILKLYTSLTGSFPVPQKWTLGYHQSRWSYKSEKEVKALAKKMRELKIPCDVIHLDIDYMDGFRVFTWNNKRFPNPEKLTQELAEDGFKIVTIIDPGVKKDSGYYVYDEGIQNGYFVTSPDGSVYVNGVWPGDSVFPDFGNPKVRKWWSDKQKFLIDSGVRGVWNDMNEPASFHGELPKDVVFTDEDAVSDHAHMHNVYGSLMSQATYEGLKEYDGRRPFVITRACYSGAQKFTTAWTGDNHSIWAHLQMAIPQLCNLSISGMAFVGTDVGGFGSDATPELLSRWVQVGCFSPLFRNHSTLDCARQEPWVFGEKTLNIYRKYVQLRYKMIPYFYDLLFAGEKNGLPMMRPLVMHYQQDENVRNLNDEFLVGEALLVAPVVNEGETIKKVYLPEGNWFDFWTGEKVSGGNWILRDAPIDVCPIYVKSGSILPQWPVQDSVKEVDELILNLYEGDGEYHHYQDNGEDFAYRQGEYNEYLFKLCKGVFTAEYIHKGFSREYKSFKLSFRGNSITVPWNGEKITVKL